MSVYRDKKEWNKWNEMVLASEHAKEDFNDFADDRAVIQADKKIQSLLSKNYTLERQLAEANKLTVNVLNNMKMILDDDEVAYKRRLDALVRNVEELLEQRKEQG